MRLKLNNGLLRIADGDIGAQFSANVRITLDNDKALTGYIPALLVKYQAEDGELVEGVCQMVDGEFVIPADAYKTTQVIMLTVSNVKGNEVLNSQPLYARINAGNAGGADILPADEQTWQTLVRAYVDTLMSATNEKILQHEQRIEILERYGGGTGGGDVEPDEPSPSEPIPNPLADGLLQDYTNLNAKKYLVGGASIFNTDEHDWTVVVKTRKNGSNYQQNWFGESRSNECYYAWNWNGEVQLKWHDSGYRVLTITPDNLSEDMTLITYARKSGADIKLYVNGETDWRSLSGTLDTTYATGDETINHNAKIVDRMLIYDRALTDDEILLALDAVENDLPIEETITPEGGTGTGSGTGTGTGGNASAFNSYSYFEQIGDSLTFGGWGVTTNRVIRANRTSHAQNGAKMVSNAQNASAMVYQSTQVSDNCDLCTIMGGTNDSAEIVAGKIGTIGTKDTTTYLGCYQTVIENLLAKNPLMRIFIIVPPRRFDYVDGAYLQTVREKCIELGDYYGIPVIDAYNDLGLNAITKDVLLNADGLHFSADGNVRMGAFVANQILSY